MDWPIGRRSWRYAEEGVEGLLHDKTRPPGTAPVPMTTVAKVLALTCAEPPGETTHWTGRAMAAAVGLSLRTLQRIWEAHRLQPHRRVWTDLTKMNVPASETK